MSEIFADNLIWVLLYPLWLFMLIGTARFFAVKFSNNLIAILTILGAFLGFVCTSGAIPYIFSAQTNLETVFNFITINNFILQIGVSVDKLSIISLLLLYLVSLFVDIYSMAYMAREEKFYRFFANLNLFSFAMSILLVAPNLFQAYIAWELIGVASYLFIGFNYISSMKSFAALKTYLLTKIGDLAFFTGLVVIVYLMYAYAPTRFVTLDFSDFNAISSLIFAHTNEQSFIILSSLFVIAALVKSAQLPFNTWLLSAMEAHTPVSALIHSATLVVAGVFLLLRLLPMLSLSSLIMSAIAVCGMLTALYCSLCAIFQKKVKSVLAYSTSAHIGLMFAAIGMGNPELALVYMVIHGLIKASLFLSYGTSNNEYEKTKNIVLLPSFLVAALVLSGIAFVGINIKELFWLEFKGNLLLTIEYLLVTFLGAVYMFRLCSLYFSVKQKFYNRKEFFSVWGLILLTVLSSFFVKWVGLGLPLLVAILGMLVAVVVVKTIKTKPLKFLIHLRRGFYLDNIYTQFFPSFYSCLAKSLLTIEDMISYSVFVVPLSRKLVKFVAWIEKYIFEFPVKFIVFCLRFASKEFEIVQTKDTQAYIAYAVLIIGVVFTTILLTYSLIIHIRGGLG